MTSFSLTDLFSNSSYNTHPSHTHTPPLSFPSYFSYRVSADLIKSIQNKKKQKNKENDKNKKKLTFNYNRKFDNIQINESQKQDDKKIYLIKSGNKSNVTISMNILGNLLIFKFFITECYLKSINITNLALCFTYISNDYNSWHNVFVKLN